MDGSMTKDPKKEAVTKPWQNQNTMRNRMVMVILIVRIRVMIMVIGILLLGALVCGLFLLPGPQRPGTKT